MAQTPKHPNLGILWFLLGSFGAGFIGYEGALRGLGDWYLVIEKPTWAIHVPLFVPTASLATWIATGAGLLAKQGERKAKAAFVLYWAQLGVQALWPWLLFAWHLQGPALAAIGVSWALGLAVTVLFFRSRLLAGLMMLPYLAWIVYGAALTNEIFRLNRPHPGRSALASPSASFGFGLRVIARMEPSLLLLRKPQ